MNDVRYPLDWQQVSLGDICYINKHSLPEKTSKEYRFKYIDLSSVDKGNIVFPNQYILFKDAPSRARRRINRNDIIMSTVRPNLKGFALVNFDPSEFICSTGFAVLTAKERTSNRYIYQLLFSKEIEMQIKNMLVGSNYPAINSSDIASLKIYLPPLPEQEKIAEILGTWDEAIEKLSGLIEQKKLLKKGLMQKLLTGKVRLSTFTQPWKEVKLDEIGTTYMGLSGKNKDNFGQGSYFIPYMNIYQNNRINPQQLELVEVGEGEKQNIVKYGDIFFTTSSETPKEVGFASVLLFKPEQNIYLNSFCFGYRLNDFQSLLPEYASFLFRSTQARKIMYKLAQGATRFNLSKNELMKEKIYIPSNISEQHAIAEVLSTADDEINLLNQKLEATKEQKKGLMQQLLTGQVRVKVN